MYSSMNTTASSASEDICHAATWMLCSRANSAPHPQLEGPTNESEKRGNSNWQTLRPAAHECPQHSEAPARIGVLFTCRSRPRLGAERTNVTNVVKDLLSENLIEPLGEGESSGGRPPDIIRFKAERGCILAVDISAHGISFLLTDLTASNSIRSRSSCQRRTPHRNPSVGSSATDCGPCCANRRRRANSCWRWWSVCPRSRM